MAKNSSENSCSYEKITASFQKMILSASGWRKVFAAESSHSSSPEESMSVKISSEDRIITACAVYVFYEFLREKTRVKNLCVKTPCIALALDSRPTGPEIAEAALKILSYYNADVRFLSVAPAPEVMAYTKITVKIDGFIYVTASHNPPGYNGFKFGLGNGAVTGGDESSALIESYKRIIADKKQVEKICSILENQNIKSIEKYYHTSEVWKKESYQTYLDFNTDIFTGGRQYPDKSQIRPGIVGDLNGSARCLSIDADFFNRIGINYSFINNEAGKIVHPILPEGENLKWCSEELEKRHKQDNTFILGYMPDNDGDRGNLVYINRAGRAQLLSAQDVFAAACMAELSFMVWSGMISYNSSREISAKTAVAANGPTSMRIERIARYFGVDVFRAEVGEANAVSLAQKLADEGWIVKFLGEGSNGGNITLPATVRDPLNTIGAIIRLLKNRDILDIWLDKTGISGGRELSEKMILDDIIDTLPVFTTTETDDPLAKMIIKTKDHGLLKNNYEKVFLKEWDMQKNHLKDKMGITGWKEVNYMRISSVTGTGSSIRGNYTSGGLKIIFTDSSRNEKGFIWMRGSGTEPVFRVMADIEGKSRDNERFLLEWQRKMIELADKACF